MHILPRLRHAKGHMAARPHPPPSPLPPHPTSNRPLPLSTPLADPQVERDGAREASRSAREAYNQCRAAFDERFAPVKELQAQKQEIATSANKLKDSFRWAWQRQKNWVVALSLGPFGGRSRPRDAVGDEPEPFKRPIGSAATPLRSPLHLPALSSPPSLPCHCSDLLVKSEAELDEQLRGLHYRIEHESITLNEEKKALATIKTLEKQRERVGPRPVSTRVVLLCGVVCPWQPPTAPGFMACSGVHPVHLAPLAASPPPSGARVRGERQPVCGDARQAQRAAGHSEGARRRAQGAARGDGHAGARQGRSARQRPLYLPVPASMPACSPGLPCLPASHLSNN